MTDEMRVTVIVTGLGDARARLQQQHASTSARMVESRRVDGTIDYEQLDRPALIRKQASTTSSSKQTSTSVPDVDYLDIPAFLRRHEEA